MLRSLLAVFILLASPLLAAPPAIKKLTLRAVNPTKWDGRCPHTFRFAGEITSRRAGDVRYRWDRSDGASAQDQVIHFSAPNQRRTVSTSWARSQPGRGWVQIRVISPDVARSSKAGFSLRCR
jgi:hypothetical protein